MPTQPYPSAASNGPQSGVALKDAPLLEVEHTVSSGDELLEAGKHEDAITKYKRALLLLGGQDGVRRTALYVKLGRCAEALKRPRVAVNNYLKALGLDLTHDEAFSHAVAALEALEDFATAEDLRERRLPHVTQDEQTSLLRSNARMWAELAREPKRAIKAADSWLERSPGEAEALRLLAAQLRAAGEHERAVEAFTQLAEVLHGQDAAEAWHAAALAAHALDAQDRELDCLESAVVLDPDRMAAVEQAENLLAQREDWNRLAQLHDRVVAHAQQHDNQLASAKALAEIARERLEDPQRAAEALRRAVELSPEEADLHLSLAKMLSAAGEHDASVDAARAAIALIPREASGYRLLLGVAESARELDCAWNAAMALEELDEADLNESVLADAHRPEGLLPATAQLSDADWDTTALHGTFDGFAALSPEIVQAATLAKLEQLKKHRKLPELLAERRQDVEKSTATMIRALKWSSQLFGMPAPELYVVDELKRPIVPTPAAAATLQARKDIASGFALNELTFLWGRALYVLRPEHRLVVVFETDAELEELAGAIALAAGNAQREARRDPTLKLLSGEMQRHASADALRAAAQQLAAVDDFHATAQAWRKDLEQGASRAGLLACGDITIAAGLLRRLDIVDAGDLDSHLDSLRAFSVSDCYVAMRTRLGVARGQG